MRKPIIVRGRVWQVREHCRRHRSLQRMLLARMLDRWEMKKVPAVRWRGPIRRSATAEWERKMTRTEYHADTSAWQQYEMHKRMFIRLWPDCPSDVYQMFITSLARRLGL